MIDKDTIRIELNVEENKVYISSSTEPFYCTTEVWVGDDFVFRLENQYIEIGKEDRGWMWYKPNKNFHGNTIKVILKNIPETRITPEDPYGEELWDCNEVIVEKSCYIE